jgi:hypothetical protein
MPEAPLDEAEVRAKIEAAIRRLPILPDQQWRVPGLVRCLVLMIDGMGQGGKAPPHFRPANRETIERQLSALERRAADLADRLEGGRGAKRAREQLANLLRDVFEDTINALADAPSVKVDGHATTLRIGYVCGALPDELQTGEPVSPKDLRIIAESAAVVRSIHQTGSRAGRPRVYHAQAVANIAAEAHYNLTRRTPAVSRWSGDKPGGSFLTLVEELFKALGVKAFGLTHAEQATQNWTRKRTT